MMLKHPFCHLETGIAMTRETNSTVSLEKRGHHARFSPSDLEEGYRLMCSFLSIRKPALRAEIVKMVAELSTRAGEVQ